MALVRGRSESKGKPPEWQLLAQFFDDYQQRLRHYSEMLQTIVTGAEPRNRPNAAGFAHRVYSIMIRMVAKQPLSPPQEGAVWAYLDELQLPHGLVCIGAGTGANAHALAAKVFTDAANLWQEMNAIADRYAHLSAPSPCELFMQSWQANPGLQIFPQALSDLLHQERLKVEVALRGAPPAAGASGVRHLAAGMTWQEATERAENHVKRNGGVFPGRNALATLIRCSPATMTKVLKNSRYLAARRAEVRRGSAAGRVPAVNEVAAPPEPPASAEIELKRLVAEQNDERNREDRQIVAAKRRRRV